MKKEQHGAVRLPPPSLDERMGSKGKKKWKYTLGSNNLRGMAQAMEGDEPKGMLVL